MKAWKKEKKAKDKAADSGEYWVAFVGRTSEQVARFLKALRLDSQERFHDLAKLAALLEIDLDAESDEEEGA
jgi:hypothetical protein